MVILVRRRKLLSFFIYAMIIGSIYLIFFGDDNKNNIIGKVPPPPLAYIARQIEKRIFSTQFPENCRKTRKLLCHTWSSGYGSQVHLRALCLIVAQITNRTFIENPDDKFPYSAELGWTGFFEPISNCTVADIVDREYNRTKIDIPEKEVLEIDHFEFLTQQKFNDTYPKNLSDKVSAYHSRPDMFWVGIYETFLLRYKPDVLEFIKRKMKKLNFQDPTICLHVRRTDKLVEAEYFNISEYMVHVERWFASRIWQSAKSIRRILIFTDDTSAINELLKSYSKIYEIYYEYPPPMDIVFPKPRYNEQSLLDIAAVVYILSRCNLTVCTFSSNVCSLAYNLAQIIYGHDVSDRFISLDKSTFVYGERYVLQ